MGKSLRKAQARLNARQKGCIEARQLAVRKNSKLAGVIDKAFKLPGSMKTNHK